MSDRPRLLIVDDELLIRDLLYDFFARRDFEIGMAESGEAALAAIEDASFDTVIIDLKMPDMDGLELTDRIRSQDRDVPIILMTGHPSIDSAIAAVRKRCSDYFIKPFNLKHLSRAVDAALADRHESSVTTGSDTVQPGEILP